MTFITELRGNAEDVRFNEDFLRHDTVIYVSDQVLYSYNCCNSNSITHSQRKEAKSVIAAKASIQQINDRFIRLEKAYCKMELSNKIIYYLCMNTYEKYLRVIDECRNEMWFSDIEIEIEQSNVYIRCVETIGYQKGLAAVRFRFSKLKGKMRKTLRSVLSN